MFPLLPLVLHKNKWFSIRRYEGNTCRYKISPFHRKCNVAKRKLKRWMIPMSFVCLNGNVRRVFQVKWNACNTFLLHTYLTYLHNIYLKICEWEIDYSAEIIEKFGISYAQDIHSEHRTVIEWWLIHVFSGGEPGRNSTVIISQYDRIHFKVNCDKKFILSYNPNLSAVRRSFLREFFLYLLWNYLCISEV